MIAFDADLTILHPPAFVATDNRPGCNGFGSVLRDAANPWRRMVEEVTVGEATYRLRHPLVLTFYPFVSGGEGELVPEPSGAEPVALGITGCGKTFEEAYSNWSERLHAEVQDLLAKRDWELTSEEAAEMATVERLIDLPAYHTDTPYRVRQIGEVTRRRPIPDKVRWEDGQMDHVSLSQMPPEFAGLQAGQRFEAVALRAPGTGKLISVVYVSPLPHLPEASPTPAEWEALPKTAEAPQVSWDEV